jgi:hypothetical protein
MKTTTALGHDASFEIIGRALSGSTLMIALKASWPLGVIMRFA